MKNTYHHIRKLARQLRSTPTDAEKVAWEHLRKRRLHTLRFNRQFIITYFDEFKSIRYFIADFYCHELKLIIEIDGGYHDQVEQKKYDAYRDKILKENGFTVLHFTNKTVLEDWQGVVNRVKEYVEDKNTY